VRSKLLLSLGVASSSNQTSSSFFFSLIFFFSRGGLLLSLKNPYSLGYAEGCETDNKENLISDISFSLNASRISDIIIEKVLIKTLSTMTHG
jgi:hypothetical protein